MLLVRPTSNTRSTGPTVHLDVADPDATNLAHRGSHHRETVVMSLCGVLCNVVVVGVGRYVESGSHPRLVEKRL